MSTTRPPTSSGRPCTSSVTTLTTRLETPLRSEDLAGRPLAPSRAPPSRGSREHRGRARCRAGSAGAGRPRARGAHGLTELASSRVSLEERTRQRAETADRHERLVTELDALLEDHPGITTVAGAGRGPPPRDRRARRGPRALAARERAAHELTQATQRPTPQPRTPGSARSPRRWPPCCRAARPPPGRVSSTSAAPHVPPPKRFWPRRRCARPWPTSRPRPGWSCGRLAESGRLRDEQHAAHEQATRRVPASTR